MLVAAASPLEGSPSCHAPAPQNPLPAPFFPKAQPLTPSPGAIPTPRRPAPPQPRRTCPSAPPSRRPPAPSPAASRASSSPPSTSSKSASRPAHPPRAPSRGRHALHLPRPLPFAHSRCCTAVLRHLHTVSRLFLTTVRRSPRLTHPPRTPPPPSPGAAGARVRGEVPRHGPRLPNHRPRRGAEGPLARNRAGTAPLGTLHGAHPGATHTTAHRTHPHHQDHR